MSSGFCTACGKFHSTDVYLFAGRPYGPGCYPEPVDGYGPVQSYDPCIGHDCPHSYEFECDAAALAGSACPMPQEPQQPAGDASSPEAVAEDWITAKRATTEAEAEQFYTQNEPKTTAAVFAAVNGLRIENPDYSRWTHDELRVFIETHPVHVTAWQRAELGRRLYVTAYGKQPIYPPDSHEAEVELKRTRRYGPVVQQTTPVGVEHTPDEQLTWAEEQEARKKNLGEQS